MTNEEIIAILESYKNYEDSRTEDLLHHGYDNTKEATKRKEALDEAIKALSVPEREKGEYIKKESVLNFINSYRPRYERDRVSEELYRAFTNLYYDVSEMQTLAVGAEQI